MGLLLKNEQSWETLIYSIESTLNGQSILCSYFTMLIFLKRDSLIVFYISKKMER